MAGVALVLWGTVQVLGSMLILGLQLYATITQFRGNPLLVVLSPVGLPVAWSGVRILRAGAARWRVPRWVLSLQLAKIALIPGVLLAWPAPNPLSGLWFSALLLDAGVLLCLVRRRRATSGVRFL